MPIKEKDFVLINYTCKVKETGEVVDTTLEAFAREVKRPLHARGHAHEEEKVYEPALIVVGEGWLPKSLEEGLVGLEQGSKATLELPPEKAYGLRDPSKVKLLPLRRFRAQGITPLPGMEIEIDGKSALVRTSGAGRVQVDYNHPLAGKTLIYEVSIEKILETPEDKIKSIIHKNLPGIDKEKFNLRILNKELTIEVPQEAFFVEGIQSTKQSISNDVQKFIPEIEKISFVEIFKKPEIERPKIEEKQEATKPEEGRAIEKT
ncbi:MAG: FKBP-type peptidyl-prolyl cis-trans isomerase [Candidatus Bathyarchaeia archaeon]